MSPKYLPLYDVFVILMEEDFLINLKGGNGYSTVPEEVKIFTFTSILPEYLQFMEEICLPPLIIRSPLCMYLTTFIFPGKVIYNLPLF